MTTLFKMRDVVCGGGSKKFYVRTRMVTRRRQENGRSPPRGPWPSKQKRCCQTQNPHPDDVAVRVPRAAILSRGVVRVETEMFERNKYFVILHLPKSLLQIVPTQLIVITSDKTNQCHQCLRVISLSKNFAVSKNSAPLKKLCHFENSEPFQK